MPLAGGCRRGMQLQCNVVWNCSSLTLARTAEEKWRHNTGRTWRRHNTGAIILALLLTPVICAVARGCPALCALRGAGATSPKKSKYYLRRVKIAFYLAQFKFGAGTSPTPNRGPEIRKSPRPRALSRACAVCAMGMAGAWSSSCVGRVVFVSCATPGGAGTNLNDSGERDDDDATTSDGFPVRNEWFIDHNCTSTLFHSTSLGPWG